MPSSGQPPRGMHRPPPPTSDNRALRRGLFLANAGLDHVYDFILEEKLITVVAGASLAFGAVLIAGRRGMLWRGIAFSYMPVLAAAFFLVAPLSSQPVPIADAAGGLLFEFTVLCIYYRLFSRLYAQTRRLAHDEAGRLLSATLLMQLVLAWPLLAGEGFGILSEGSRIDYLYAGSLGKYLTYSNLLLMSVQAVLLAGRVSRAGRLARLDLVVIVITFATSVLSGSKGSFFLWVFAVLALVDYARARIPTRTIAGVSMLVLAAMVLSSVVVSEFLGISVEDFFDLALNRFFLNNDARALAFDFRNAATPNAGLLAESFRSVASLFGYPPQNSPLGVHLYGLLFGVEASAGANASLAALIVYYSPAGYAAVPLMLAACGALILAVFFAAARRAMRATSSRAMVFTFALFALLQYSQDFLAFQAVMPIVLIAIAIVWLYDHLSVNARRACRRRSDAPVAAGEHRRSGLGGRRGTTALR